MNDLEKLNYLMKHHDSEELLKELFNIVQDNEDVQEWLDDNVKGKPDYDDTGFDYMDEYERNSDWRTW